MAQVLQEESDLAQVVVLAQVALEAAPEWAVGLAARKLDPAQVVEPAAQEWDPGQGLMPLVVDRSS